MVLVHKWGVDAILASRSSIRLRLSGQSELDRMEWCKSQNKRKSVFAQTFWGQLSVKFGGFLTDERNA